MVVQGELIVKFETIAKGVGELVGGFSTAGKGKQPEGDPTKLGLMGGLGAKALMGSEGFGGLKKTMGVMAGPIGKLGGSLMKGGVIGMATAGITSIMGIVSKALGSSSIFTGVAAQFWKIAGVMVDMLLMPLLPYMMKFIQWMMTTVMPEIMKLSKGISRALSGDIGPLLSAYFSLVFTVMEGMYIKLPRMLLDPLIVAINNTIPFRKDITVEDLKQKRKDKEAGMGDDGGIMGSKKMQAASMIPGLGGVVVAAQGIMSVKEALTGTEEKQKEFGENLTKNAQDTQREMSSFVDGEKNKGKVWWKRWDWAMYKGSILPGIKDDTHAYMDTLSKEAENSGDGLFSWVNGINWGIFGTVGTAIKDAAMAVWGAVTGFFTGKDSEGAEVTPNLLSILPGLPSFPSLSDIDIVDSIKKKAKDIYSSIMGFFTGKDSEGAEVTPNLLSILPGLPSFPDLSDIEIVEKITTKAKEIWGSIDTFFTETLPGYIPTWTEIQKGITDGVKGLGSLLGAAKTAVVEKVKDLWGSWNPSGIMGIIPDLLSNIPGWDTVYSAAKNVVGGIANLLGDATSAVTGKVKDIWGQWSTTVSSEGVETTPNGIAGIIPNLLGKLPLFEKIFSMETYTDLGAKAKNFLTGKLKAIWGQWSESTNKEGVTTEPNGIAGIIPNLLSRLPLFEKIFSMDTYKDLGTLAKDKVTEILGTIWGSWSGKTGIAGIIPLLVSKIPDVSSLMGDLSSISVQGVSKKQRDELVDKFGAKEVSQQDTFDVFGTQTGTTFDMEVSIVEYFKQIGSMIKEKAMIPVNWVKDKYNSLKAMLDNLSLPDWDFGDLLSIVKDIANAVIGGINQAICWIVEKYNSTIGKIGFPADWKVVGGMGLSITPPQIGKWHTGGIVPGGPSAQVPAILQGGEQVIPRSARSQMGGGGGTNQTFNININSNFSPGDIIRSIAQSGATDEVAYLNTVG